MSTHIPATPSPKPHEPKSKPASKVRYNADIAARLCERIATTPQSMLQICEAPDMPGIATVFRWLRDHPDFREMYVIAKQEQVEILMDECFQIVDDTSNDLIVTADGRKIPNPVAVQRAKLRVNYRKWIASKLLPRKYGNNAQLEAATPPPPPPPPNGGLPVLTKEMLLHLQERRRRALEADRLHNPHTFKTPPPAPQS